MLMLVTVLMREMDYTAAQRRDERDAIQKGKSALNS